MDVKHHVYLLMCCFSKLECIAYKKAKQRTIYKNKTISTHNNNNIHQTTDLQQHRTPDSTYLIPADAKVGDRGAEDGGHDLLVVFDALELGAVDGAAGIVQHLHQRVFVNVLGGEASSHHIVRTRHALHAVWVGKKGLSLCYAYPHIYSKVSLSICCAYTYLYSKVSVTVVLYIIYRYGL